jgi:hypothetical protein
MVPIYIKTCRTTRGARPYIYKFPGKTPGKPEIVSYGADRKPGGGEGENADIVSE